MAEPFSVLATLYPLVDHKLEVGMLIFTRLIAFLKAAPVFNRKEVPGMVKISFALILTIIMAETIAGTDFKDRGEAPYYLLLLFNAIIGFFIGFVANLIFSVISAAGDFANNQMGLSSATLLDPTQQAQTSLAGMLFSLLGVVIFINIDGPYWLLLGIYRTFEIFPIFSYQLNLTDEISLEYIIVLAGDILTLGMLFVAPIMVVTLAQDLLLGIVSKTAPQINVFQLSFIFKPVVGIVVLLVTMPIMINLMNWHFVSHSQLF